MKHLRGKSAEDVIVSDPEAAMRRMTEATRHILTIPKPDTQHAERRKPRKKK